MNFKIIMLSERSQTQEAVYYMCLFILHSGKGKAVGTEKSSVGARGSGWG